MRTVTIGGLRMPGFAEGGWLLQELTGWDTLSDSKAEVVERPRRRGAFGVSSVDRAALAVSVRATYLGNDQVDLEAATSRLKGLVAAGPVLMTVDKPSGSRWRFVTVENITPRDTRGWNHGVFDIDMIARDPLQYGQDVGGETGLSEPGTGIVFPIVFPIDLGTPSVPATVTVVNAGTAPAYPVFTMSGGGVSSFTVTARSTAGRLTWAAPIGEGSVVTLDSRRRRALLNGGYVSAQFMSSREWPVVQPGQGETFTFSAVSPSGAPRLSVELTPGWW